MRNPDKGAPIAAAYPKVRLVYGTLDDSKVIEDESARADIILRKISPWEDEIEVNVLWIRYR